MVIGICSVLNTYDYLQKTITTNLLTITMNDSNSLLISQLCTAMKNQVEPKIKGEAKTKKLFMCNLGFYLHLDLQTSVICLCLSVCPSAE